MLDRSRFRRGSFNATRVLNDWWSFIALGLVVFGVVGIIIAVKVVQDSVDRDDRFDYVIVGGGTAGCLMAEYLSRDQRHRVLLLEAGDYHGDDEDIDVVLRPSLNLQRDHYAEYFWQQQQEQNEVLPPDSNHSYTTGRLLGGESSVGDSRYNRGTAEYYDFLATYLNDTIWNSTNMLEILTEVELYYAVDNTSFAMRGHEGAVKVAEQGTVTTMASKFVAAIERVTELPPLSDYNDMNVSNVVGPFERWQTMVVNDAKRVTSDKVHLTEEVRARPNLVVRLHSTVTKVLFTKHKEAYAVAYLENGRYREAWGKERIVLTAGVNSPLILQQSGIGDGEHLESMDIDVVHHNPSVGSIIFNHNGITVRFNKNGTDAPSGMLSDQYEGGAWLPSPMDDDDEFRTERRIQATAINKGDVMELQFFNLQPFQHGYAYIRDNDPLRAPESSDQIFLGEDGTHDSNFYVGTIYEYGCALTNAFQGEDYVDPIDTQYYMIDPPFSYCSDEPAMRDWVRSHATVQAHDWAGSTRMGPVGNEESVCNSKGSVIGVTGLTVADKSILPQTPDGTGIAAEYGVALNIAKQVLARNY